MTLRCLPNTWRFNRSFNPIIKRFTGWDNSSPFDAGGPHGYAYCTGDPANNTDPTGHLILEVLVDIFFGTVATRNARRAVEGAGAAEGVEAAAAGGAEAGSVNATGRGIASGGGARTGVSLVAGKEIPNRTLYDASKTFIKNYLEEVAGVDLKKYYIPGINEYSPGKRRLDITPVYKNGRFRKLDIKKTELHSKGRIAHASKKKRLRYLANSEPLLKGLVSDSAAEQITVLRDRPLPRAPREPRVDVSEHTYESVDFLRIVEDIGDSTL